MIWDEQPSLHDPFMVVAFKGWNDAADAASNSMAWMRHRWNATKVGHLDPDPYFDFQAVRPQVKITGGVTREIDWPAIEFHAARPANAEHDALLVSGVEPSFSWRGICDELLEVASALGCRTIVTIGALLADTPHTRPTRLIGTAPSAETVKQLGLVESRYEGPTGIVGALHDACRRAQVPSISLWAPVPHYLAVPPNPKATRALLIKVPELLGATIDLHEMDWVSKMWEQQINRVVANDAEMAAYIARLEEQADTAAAEELVDGETLAAQFEDYLRDQGNPSTD